MAPQNLDKCAYCSEPLLQRTPGAGVDRGYLLEEDTFGGRWWRFCVLSCLRLWAGEQSDPPTPLVVDPVPEDVP